MLSRNQQKLIRSLHQKKQREKHGLFLIEGNTIITDLVQSGQIHAGNLELLAATPEWLERTLLKDPGREIDHVQGKDPGREIEHGQGKDPGREIEHGQGKDPVQGKAPGREIDHAQGKNHGVPEVSSLSRLAVSADPADLKKLSGLVSPPEVIAVLKMPAEAANTSLVPFRPEQLREDVTLVFESIRDPGNLGTIIRTADWFGIRNIICSPDSVDTYNNKVVQASMGAVLRTRPNYMELTELFEAAGRFKIPVYGTAMDGADFYDTPVRVPGLIVFGNESRGISKSLETYFRQKIRIPDFPAGAPGTESLNVATSVGVICAEIRRRQR